MKRSKPTGLGARPQGRIRERESKGVKTSRDTITETSHFVSLAYRLGDPQLSGDENQSLYGVRSGQEVRGQNLKITTHWLNTDRLPVNEFVNSIQLQSKELLKEWDHQFLNDKSVFKNRPMTLEFLSLSLAKEFWALRLSECTHLSVEQGKWRVELEKESSKIILTRSTRLQSMIRIKTSLVPLDFILFLSWTSELNSKTHLLLPWVELKEAAQSGFENITKQPEDFFNSSSISTFLTSVAKILKASDSTKLLSHIQFEDKKAGITYSIKLTEDLS